MVSKTRTCSVIGGVEHGITTRVYQYAEFQTEADMNLYEIYFILKWHPPLNVDDKTRDYPTVSLPDVSWQDWDAPIFERWKTEIVERRSEEEKNRARYREIHAFKGNILIGARHELEVAQFTLIADL